MNNPVISTIGLIADTHFQYYLFDLPEVLRDWFSDVDLILHAGDVGETSVLDLLGKHAPVVAVHGNDEPEYVKRELPNDQLLTIQDHRILLWHGHYPNPIEDKTNRKGTWRAKLERIANRGREVNARIVIFGHTHIPLVYQHNDILLINPGALTSGSYFTRQAVKTIAKLFIHADGSFKVTHIDIDQNTEIILDEPNLDDDFSVLARQYQEWMVEPDLIIDIGAIKQIDYVDVKAVLKALIPLYKNHLKYGLICRQELINTIQTNNGITPRDKNRILDVLLHQ